MFLLLFLLIFFARLLLPQWQGLAEDITGRAYNVTCTIDIIAYEVLKAVDVCDLADNIASVA
ncbi:hypothetical protein FOPG_18121 [Fusarium oxysporum f. sp. conglutinans race 2 54008]|uniref:Uncharacterized protein n=1 Tax=Fusarium oxysporum f. sp. conglutinans race 2 54008 TaxID=1089457 RepID=X0HWZ4_FUSOX|nr:hypothetical protein FOPG_18121 [Fusarium oxysporum f. sp. conglutinans race 2 54008]